MIVRRSMISTGASCFSTGRCSPYATPYGRIAILDAARKRKLTVLLIGNIGNLGLSYNGLELLPELFRNGRWLCWLREARALVTPEGGMRWRGVLANTLGPWCPAALWVWLNSVVHRRA